MPRRPEDLLRGTVEVGTVQTFYHRLSEVMDHPLSSATDVGRVISEDPGLTTRLLRLVNSPIYGFPSRIVTVPQAISVVGLTQLRDLALGTAFMRLFQMVPSHLVDMDSFWRHSIGCGLAARLIASQRREANVERFFVAGLLHDIGRPIIYTKAPLEAASALMECSRSGQLLFQVEQKILGFHHGVVGSLLLQRWRLPAMLVEVTAHHHSPKLAMNHPTETAIVHLADIIANALKLGSSGEHLVPSFEPAAWEAVGLSETALPTLFKQVERQFGDAVGAIMDAAAYMVLPGQLVTTHKADPEAQDAARAMNRWLLDALDLVARVGITQPGRSEGESATALLQNAGNVLTKLCNFDGLAFFLRDADSIDFPLSSGGPEERLDAVRLELEAQISSGVFAWALAHNHPVVVPAREHEGSVMLHVLTTRSEPIGMFIGLMPDRSPFIPDGCQKLISIVLSSCAATLRSEALRDELRRTNKDLEATIEARTAEVRQARDTATQASHAKSEFLANMSHEIRTPMNAVLGTASMLLECKLDEEQRGLAETIVRSGGELLKLINDILDFSKLEAGKLRFEAIRFDLHDTIKAVVDLLTPKADAKSIRLRAKVDSETPRFVLGDPGRLRQILTNLVDNAIKFTGEGFVMISVSAEPSTGAQTTVMFVIRDSGIGIPVHKQAAIFEKFTQADASTTRRFGGSGLGLAICRQLTELMGGTIGLESSDGVGSTFRVSVPFGTAEATAADTPLPARQVRLTGRVLLAEDYPANQRIAIWMLQKLGLEVDVAANGLEALAMLGAHHYDAVLMDCQMPELDGYDATRRIRTNGGGDPDIPIIAMTASALPTDRERCLAAGMNDYISKPVQPHELGKVLERWLSNGGTTARRQDGK